MNSRFENVPIEADTRILRREIITVGGYEVLNDLLEKLARESPLVNPNSQMTIKRDESGYSFVNFNFEY